MSIAGSTSQIVLFESSDGEISLDVEVDAAKDQVWLSKDQMALLFARDRSVISRHIANVYSDGEVDREATCAKFAHVQKEGDRKVRRETDYYNLDVIISVGYRVKSQRGVEFRRWATDVLKRYIIEGRAENSRRIAQLAQAVSLMERVSDDLDTAQVLEIVKRYARALDLLDDYDHQRLAKPAGSASVYILDYEESRNVIDAMRFKNESDLFGVEKDDSFRSSIAAIYQTFGGIDMYPSVQEKAANLLYFVVKNHSFHDGNKRIAASMFLYFLDKNGLLFHQGGKSIDDGALVAMTIMIAESKPEEKEAMVALIMNFLLPS